MSKYDDLCTAYKGTIAKYKAKRAEALAFTNKLCNGFVEYLGAPDGSLRYFDEEGQHVSVIEAVKLTDEGNWEFHAGIVIEATGARPNLLAFHYVFRKVKDVMRLTVTSGKLTESFDISESGKEFDDCWGWHYEKTVTHFEKGFEKFIEGKHHSGIGFAADSFE